MTLRTGSMIAAAVVLVGLLFVGGKFSLAPPTGEVLQRVQRGSLEAHLSDRNGNYLVGLQRRYLGGLGSIMTEVAVERAQGDSVAFAIVRSGAAIAVGGAVYDQRVARVEIGAGQWRQVIQISDRPDFLVAWDRGPAEQVPVQAYAKDGTLLFQALG